MEAENIKIKDKQKFQQKLYEQHYRKMMGVCLRYSKDKDEAKDILHESFIKVFNKIDRFDNKGSLEGWIRKIVVNTAIDSSRKTIHITAINEKYDAIQEEIEEENDLYDDFSVEEIMQMVQNLSPAYRTVFNMYAIERYSHKEIAEKLGISEGTSKSNLAKARMNLKKMFYECKKIEL